MNEEEVSVGVLGGSFNPVHLGHLIIAQDALEAFELQKILFMPCAAPPHKPDALAPARHRLAMLELALESHPALEASSHEIDRGGVSYTIDTLDALSAAHPGTSFCFIIGADSLPELYQWKDIDRLLDEYTFLLMSRPGFLPDTWDADRLRLSAERIETLRAHTCRAHDIGISATDIRRRAAEGMSIKFLVPDAVEMYIMEHHLYTH